MPQQQEVEERISEAANSLLIGQRQLKVLEAGCGSASKVRFHAPTYTVGIDISRDALESNALVQEKIVGDIQEYPLPKEEFDAVVCWMVLEHVPRPQDALRNLFRTVKPGGLVILGFPNLLSFKGMITKLTPYWFHRLYFRMMKYSGGDPCPTCLRAAILPQKLLRFAGNHGFSAPFCELVESRDLRRLRSKFWLADLVFSGANSVIQAATLGRSQSLLLDTCAMVLTRRA
ncbi:MAG: class I SAM-dependent methyltransferase [Terriglobia bacterium]